MPEVISFSGGKRRLLEKYLRGELGQNSLKLDPITCTARAETAPPLSLAQQQLWLRELHVAGTPPLYNECVTLDMRTPIDVAVLEESFLEIIRRHEIWRTTFRVSNGEPVQIIDHLPQVKLAVLDLRRVPKAEREGEALQRISEEARLQFDLERGPLIRPTLVTFDDREHRLFLIAHQMILDGISAYQIFPSELAALYKAFSAGKPSPLPTLAVQYADFANWQRQWLQGEVLARQMNYWRKQLGSQPPVLN